MANDEQLAAAHQASWRARFSKRVYERRVTIPWDASMGLPEQTDWLE